MRRQLGTTITGALAAVAVAAGLLIGIPTSAGAATIFDPGDIISDAEFYNGNAMSSLEIQSFLDAKVGTCTNDKCLNVALLSVPNRAREVSTSTGNLICEAITGGVMMASELIYRSQVACGISAKVILVTLQKEQGLVTSRAPSDPALRWAMGMACPDTAPCDTAFAGLATQIVSGTRQLKAYKASAFARQPGVHFMQYHPNGACGGTNVNVRNYATAALYNYTPYQPNAASLANLYRTGDSCSSYGNRNFWAYFRDWFGFVDGPPPGSPSAPQGLMTTRNHGGELTLSWSPPANFGDTAVTDYRISYTSVHNAIPVIVDDGVSTSTSHTFADPTPGIAFTFRVQAVNAVGAGTPAEIKVTAPDPGAPSEPRNLRVTVNDGAALTLVWDAPASPGTSTVSDYVISYTSVYHPTPVVVNDGVSAITTQTFVGATPGLAFTFRVQAKNSAGLSAEAKTSATPPTAGQPAEDFTRPGAVSGLRISVNDGSTLKVEWEPPASTGSSPVTDYVITYTSAYHPSPVVADDGVSTTTSHTFSDPTRGLEFTIRVQARNAAGLGALASILVTPPDYPDAPRNLRTTVNDGSALTIVWDEPGSNGGSAVTDYVISYTSPYHTTPVVVSDGVSTATTHTFVNPTPGLPFMLRVQAKNAVGVGSVAQVQATAPATTVSIPAAPTSLAVTSNTWDALTVVWAAPPGVVTDYLLSWRSPLTPTWQLVGDGVSTSTSHTFVGSSPGVTFEIRVQAKNASGTGPAAIVLASTPAGSPPNSAPAPLRATPVDGGAVTLEWAPPPGTVTDYVISYMSPYHTIPVIVDDGVSTATAWTTTPTPGLTFVIRVQAKNQFGVGPAATISVRVSS